MDLTAGVNVAPMVFLLIDTNRDGQISAAEGRAYAQQVFSSMMLSVDGGPVPLTLVDQQFPEFREMSLGVGAIRLRGTATVPAAAAGRHQVFYRNTHQSEISVYLANALVPVDKQIEIAGQRRDYAQHELTVDYRVIPDAPWASSWWLIVGLATAGVLGVTLWPRGLNCRRGVSPRVFR